MTFSSVVDREVETPGTAVVVSCRTLLVSGTCFREDRAKPLVSGAVLRTLGAVLGVVLGAVLGVVSGAVLGAILGVLEVVLEVVGVVLRVLGVLGVLGMLGMLGMLGVLGVLGVVSVLGAASIDLSSSSESDVSSAFLRASSGSYSGLATVRVVINAGTRSKATTP